MAEARAVIEIDVEEFKVCPKCGYEDGFHSVFEGLGKADAVKWLLICPQCSSMYDIGLKYNG
jgi:uncharacterized C2H2 Zn-finger protein